MSSSTRAADEGRGIALVAHDGRKADLCAWTGTNRKVLSRHRLYATGTTGQMLRNQVGLEVTCLSSGPLGGDQQIGSRIVEGQIDVLIFFWDPLENHPHTADVQALQRVATLRNIPTAYNARTAQFLITSPLLSGSEAGPVPEGPKLAVALLMLDRPFGVA